MALVTPDYVIVGAGATGLTLAYALSAIGKKCLVIEQDKVSGGSHTIHERQGMVSSTKPCYYSASFLNFRRLLMKLGCKESTYFTQGHNHKDHQPSHNNTVISIPNNSPKAVKQRRNQGSTSKKQPSLGTSTNHVEIDPVVDLFQTMTWQERFQFYKVYFWTMFNKAYGSNISCEEFLSNPVFQPKTCDAIKSMILWAGNGINVQHCSLHTMIQMFNQKILYDVRIIPQPQQFFDKWTTHLVETGLVEFQFTTEMTQWIYSDKSRHKNSRRIEQVMVKNTITGVISSILPKSGVILTVPLSDLQGMVMSTTDLFPINPIITVVTVQPTILYYFQTMSKSIPSDLNLPPMVFGNWGYKCRLYHLTTAIGHYRAVICVTITRPLSVYKRHNFFDKLSHQSHPELAQDIYHQLKEYVSLLPPTFATYYIEAQIPTAPPPPLSRKKSNSNLTPQPGKVVEKQTKPTKIKKHEPEEWKSSKVSNLYMIRPTNERMTEADHVQTSPFPSIETSIVEVYRFMHCFFHEHARQFPVKRNARSQIRMMRYYVYLFLIFLILFAVGLVTGLLLH